MSSDKNKTTAQTLGEATAPAMKRAAKRAREIARLAGTTIVISRNGEVVEVQPDELKEDVKKGV